MIMRMNSFLAAAAVCACVGVASAASASTYNIDGNFNGVILDASITTGAANNAAGPGGYNITSISGSISGPNGGTITGLVPVSGIPSNLIVNNIEYTYDNIFFPSTGQYFDYSGVLFYLNGSVLANLFGDSMTLYELASGNSWFPVLDVTTSSLSVTQTPLPGTWTMLLAGLFGLVFVAYRGSKKMPTACAVA
jgi:hypothetical protein